MFKKTSQWRCFAPQTRDLGTLSTGIGVATSVLVAGTLFGDTGFITAACMAPFAAWGIRQQTNSAYKYRQFDIGCGKVHDKEKLNEALEKAMSDFRNGASNAACYVLRFDNLPNLLKSHGPVGLEILTKDVAQRISDFVRSGDIVTVLERGVIAICTTAIRRFDIETGLQIADRLQAILRQPFYTQRKMAHVSAHIGFCFASRAPSADAHSMLSAASRALNEAASRVQSRIFAYSSFLDGLEVSDDLSPFVAEAFEKGQIIPFFQPQVDTVTGTLRGVEALARWIHPERGIIPPLEFLCTIKAAGLWEQLTDTILDQALSQLVEWEKAGIYVPKVGVNFEEADLANPKITDRIDKALAKYNLPGTRLAVEIVESVMGESNQYILKSLNALAKRGCDIEIDDFGTGHAAISTLRAFPAKRLKIDRSFVIRLDEDADQQNMMATIIMMANRMGLDTLAEGVETDGERSALAKLGCRTIQGFGIGRPMPAAQFPEWVQKYTPDHCVVPILRTA